MSELKALTPEELSELYPIIVNLRKQVLEIVDKYGYSASSLVSRTFEDAIALEFGRKYLKNLAKENE